MFGVIQLVSPERRKKETERERYWLLLADIALRQGKEERELRAEKHRKSKARKGLRLTNAAGTTP